MPRRSTPAPHHTTRRDAARRAGALALLVATSACRTWRAEPVPAGATPGRAVAAHVRATRADGTWLELREARVDRDTLRGVRWSADGLTPATPTAIPLDSVRRLEARRVSTKRTVWLGVGLMSAVFLGLPFGASDS
jgi:hypothetical protein